MDRQKLLDKAEAALEKSLDTLAKQDQPCDVEQATKSIYAVLELVKIIG
jgi:hypothetical protein